MKLNTTKYSPIAFHGGLLWARIVLGVLMILNHGLPKIEKYEVLKTEFYNFMGLGPQFSLTLAILAEVMCSLLIIFGLFTRLATIPLIITMIVAVSANNWAVLGKAEMGFLYLAGFVFLFLIGPGSYSLDEKMNNQKRFFK